MVAQFCQRAINCRIVHLQHHGSGRAEGPGWVATPDTTQLGTLLYLERGGRIPGCAVCLQRHFSALERWEGLPHSDLNLDPTSSMFSFISSSCLCYLLSPWSPSLLTDESCLERQLSAGPTPEQPLEVMSFQPELPTLLRSPHLLTDQFVCSIIHPANVYGTINNIII